MDKGVLAKSEGPFSPSMRGSKSKTQMLRPWVPMTSSFSLS